MSILLNSLLSLLLYFILFQAFKKNNFLLDTVKKGKHKLIEMEGAPLMGGLFFYLIFLISFYFNQSQIINFHIFLSLSSILILGIFADQKENFNPNIRLLIQVILITIIVIFFEIKVNKTNIFFIDAFLNISLFNYFFTIFCIAIVINGINLIDGFNGISTGYFLMSFLSILILIMFNNEIFDENINFVNFIIPGLLIFYLANLFGKVLLGDNGVYFLSAFLSFYLIILINKNQSISPIYAVNILWYPAFENLFSIIRRLKAKKQPFFPDRLHLHSLLNLYLLNKLNIKNKKFVTNSLTGLIINFSLLPGIIIGVMFYNSSLVLGVCSIIYIMIYITAYYIFSKKV